VFSLTLVPGRFFCFSASSCCLCCSSISFSTSSNSPINSSTAVCCSSTFAFVPSTAFSALPNKSPFISKFKLTPTRIKSIIIVIINAISVIPLFFFIFLFLPSNFHLIIRQISSELLFLFKIEPTMETLKEVFRGSSIFSKNKTPAFGCFLVLNTFLLCFGRDWTVVLVQT